MRAIFGFLSALLICGPVAADMKAELLAPWDGKRIPAGQQCPLFGGKGEPEMA